MDPINLTPKTLKLDSNDNVFTAAGDPVVNEVRISKYSFDLQLLIEIKLPLFSPVVPFTK